MLLALLLGVLPRAAASAVVVVAATVAAESAGPFWGALIVSLPVAAGPAYVMLALQHDAAFIASSALESLAVNAASFVFLAALALSAVRIRWAGALAGSLIAWLGAVLLIRQLSWGVFGASLLNLGSLCVSLALTRSLSRDAAMPAASSRRAWYELPTRAAMVGLTVGAVVTGSRMLGPELTGIAAVFPVAFTSFAIVVLPRVGGVVGPAIMVSALRAMPGLALSLLTLHLAVVPCGAAPALMLALLASLAWSVLLVLGYGTFRDLKTRACQRT